MNEKLAEALGYVDGKYVSEAARRKKHKKKILFPMIAAVLAVVLFINTPTIPFVVTARAVAMPGASRAPKWPGTGNMEQWEAYRKIVDANEATLETANRDLASFYAAASCQFLTGTEENALWSPVNAAVALSILAETADGTTRQQILDLLGVSDVEILRRYIARIWEAGNETEGNQVRAMDSSLWVDKGMNYDRSVMDTLAYDYYTSVYQGNLGSGMTNRAIQTWVNNHTGGFLNQLSGGIDLTPGPKSVATTMALVSTVYLKGTWYDEFDPARNTDGIFHSPGGDKTVTYMNRDGIETTYYWGDSFGAVRLGMRNGTSLWLILPDEDKSVDQVLAEGEYLEIFGTQYTDEYANSKYMKVNLSMPKFDFSNELDLIGGLKELGVTEAFDENGGDFGETFDTDLPIFVDRISQASRISVDEQGVTASVYIELMWGAGAAAPPDEVIDFVLDRPFVFAVTTESIPMFVGVVNEP